MTNKERLEANNAKIEEITKTLKGKMLSSGDGEYFVKVIDYDGTILKESNLNAGDTFTLPTPPSHDGLVFQEWSCSQEIVDNVITITDNNVMAGAVYTTASGFNEFDIELTKVTGLDVTLNMDGTKDWGDGTSDDLTTHTYSSYGKYTIKCNGTEMTTSSSSGLFGEAEKRWCVKHIRLATIDYIKDYAIYNCYSLKTISMSNVVYRIGIHGINSPRSKGLVLPNKVKTIGARAFSNLKIESIVLPNSITTIESYVFDGNYQLKNIAIPNSITTISSDSIFQNCKNIENIILPSGITSISKMFRDCTQLKNVVLPNNLTTIGSYALYGSDTLEEIEIPLNVVDIKAYAFSGCRFLTKYDFSKCLSVPALANTNAFQYINALAKIIVPDNLYDEWIVATNWATYADYIYKASEVV